MKTTCLGLFVFFCFVHLAQGQEYSFRHYQVSSGLSNNAVLCSMQDSQGFMWFGTKDGLNRFDGTTFKWFREGAGNGVSLGSNVIQVLHEAYGYIWVGTNNGLYRYNSRTENFKLFETTKNTSVHEVQHDLRGNLWVLANSTVVKFNFKEGKTTVFPDQENFQAVDVEVLPNGEVWFSSYSGLFEYVHAESRFVQRQILGGSNTSRLTLFTCMTAMGSDKLLLGTRNKGALVYDTRSGKMSPLFGIKDPLFIRDFLLKKDTLWMATESGLFIYDFKKGEVVNLKKKYGSPFHLNDNALYCLTEDRDGGIWIGTYFGGVNYQSKDNGLFKKYTSLDEKNSIQGNVVREIRADDFGGLWLGTEDGGLNRLDLKTGKIENFNAQENGLAYNNIHGLYPTGDRLFIGTFEHGMDVMDIPSRKVIKHFEWTGKEGLKSSFIYSFFRLNEKEIAIMGTEGMQKMNLDTYAFSDFEIFPEQVFFNTLIRDRKGNFWAGTYRNGLFFKTPRGETTLYGEGMGEHALSSSLMNGLFLDRKERIWVSTQNGLNRIEPETGEIKIFHSTDGFPSNVFYEMRQDSQGNLWVGTSKGLVKMNEEGQVLRVFSTANGLLNDQFNYKSAYKAPDGRLYFGCLDGMISFDPLKITGPVEHNPIRITGFKINNKDVKVGERGSPLQESIPYARHIVLNHEQNSFSLEFSSMDFSNAELTEYAYRLRGLNSNWINIKKEHTVYFNEVPPGRYVFEVREANGNLEGGPMFAGLEIEVKPIFWKSTLAYFLYFMVLVGFVYFMIRHFVDKARERNARRLAELNVEKEREVYKAKIEFFTNVSHEIRTPLTLIKGPTEKLLKNYKKDVQLSESLGVIQKNTNRLLDLIGQLLDFRKTEMDRLSLTFREMSYTEIIQSTVFRFSQELKDRGLELKMDLGEEEVFIYADPEALKKILSNLIGNAVKYAEKHLEIGLKRKETEVELFVRNDGYLIPSSLKEKIFEPFYRIEENGTQKGTGIGLALAKSLAGLHSGQLRLDTSAESMNNFVLTLPIHQEKEFRLNGSPHKSETKEEGLAYEVKAPNDQGTLLIVEDNEDLLDFIAQDLQGDYMILKALNGAEALDLLGQEKVDLIISDVMMPVKNGFELCREVKGNIQTSHIPVILLTAKSAMESRIEGLESGADAYIEKPFSSDYLKVQVANLLDNRQNIIDYFSNSPLAHIRSIAHTKADEKFIERLDAIIDSHIADPNLSVETLAEEMHMSRSTFYRKIKEMSNLSPNELVNIARLKRAAELLQTGEYRIYEVAELVGYNSQTSFGRNFQKQFNMTPSEYMHKKA
ncbi:response regulator [Marinilongibacter aquaticus]|uniref:hybrid sensor histidine kinase/response regulator transcription factor n=1 Tax=Marinilongibacter aquaticus TaxID=2975157 RepID=UPI0021BD0231|nr:hybrid sensor histidine kinase/response regulator transcription factor [Marinilongibacter aquaticus]UBM59065.1 response regulator [Marinilongibacter aquaticus]